MNPRVALLLHELPDGTRHVDLLIEAAEGIASALRLAATGGTGAPGALTWRCPRPPDSLPSGAMLEIERTGDHRAIYLALPEPTWLSGGRGRVTPIGSGTVRACHPLEIHWTSGAVTRWVLEPMEGSMWRLTALPATQDSSVDSESSTRTGP